MSIMEICANEIVKELPEKRQMFARMAPEVGSMVSELKEVRNRMASEETSLAQESASREASEARARSLEKELEEVQRSLEAKNQRLEASLSLAQQLEKQRSTDQEIRTRLCKLEFCLHKTRAWIRKSQSMAEREEKTIKDLREEVRAIKASKASSRKQSFWKSSCFKVVASVSMVALVIFRRR